MRHHLFKESNTYDIAVLVKSTAFNKKEIYSNYVAFLEQKATCIAFDLQYVDSKASAAIIKDYLSKLLPALDSLGIKYLYVADAAYFKALVKVAKADVHYGYVLNCKIKGYEHIKCVLGVNHQQLIYNPAIKDKLMVGIEAIKKCIDGTYIPVGNGIIHSASYPEGFREAWLALEKLHQYPRLACDIEGFSLRFNEAGIGSIAFAWDQHNGIAFQVDDLQTKKPSLSMRYALRKFLEEYKGELVFHYASYDVKCIIYNLWMRDPLDYAGMLKGLHIMCRNIHDTKIIAYLATNSTAGNQLGLKTLAQSFAGNYAKDDIKDITLIPKAELLEYNLVDALSSFWVMEKYWPVVVQDKQESIYRDIMLPSMKVLIQTELIGMPMNDEKIKEAKAELVAKRDECLDLIMNSQEVKDVTLLVQTEAMVKANAKLKTKQHPIEKFKDMVFNPNSGPQLQRLIYEVMGLPVLDYTDTGQPATGGDTLIKLQAHSTSPLLKVLVEYSEAEKILSTFIPAFEEGILKHDGNRYLHGSFNLGGTVSGRLSSSSPNLQNLPSNSVYGKTIKSCFIANNDWLMAGADFASLEDRISALLTKDKNKLKVYVDQFDGHSLRAAYYYQEDLSHVDLTDPSSVNNIAKTHPHLRQESKAPTFLLTYGGTYHGLVNNCGLPQDKAKAIEKNYHTMYAESDVYIQNRLQEAATEGHTTVAFGLRVRTPLLKQVMWNTGTVPYEAQAESRTAGNAMGQSYGLLTNRATNAFMAKVWESKYRYSILPIAQIHDATYFLIRNDPEVIEWANNHLIEEMEWQELPEIQHPQVHLGAALDVFKEGWHKPITLPNRASIEEIISLLA